MVFFFFFPHQNPCPRFQILALWVFLWFGAIALKQARKQGNQQKYAVWVLHSSYFFNLYSFNNKFFILYSFNNKIFKNMKRMFLNNLCSLPFEESAVSGKSWETQQLASLSLLPGKFGNLRFQQPATSQWEEVQCGEPSSPFCVSLSREEKKSRPEDWSRKGKPQPL